MFCGCAADFLGPICLWGVILIKLRSGFIEIALLHCCSLVSLLHVCRASFLESTSGGLLLIVLYTVFNLFFLIKYAFEDFKVSVVV